MATRPEARAQLARLLDEDAVTSGSTAEIQAAVQAKLDQFAAGLVEEAVASDDVLDRQSALEFVESRLSDFATLVSDDQRAHLLVLVRERIAAW